MTASTMIPLLFLVPVSLDWGQEKHLKWWISSSDLFIAFGLSCWEEVTVSQAGTWTRLLKFLTLFWGVFCGGLWFLQYPLFVIRPSKQMTARDQQEVRKGENCTWYFIYPKRRQMMKENTVRCDGKGTDKELSKQRTCYYKAGKFTALWVYLWAFLFMWDNSEEQNGEWTGYPELC